MHVPSFFELHGLHLSANAIPAVPPYEVLRGIANVVLLTNGIPIGVRNKHLHLAGHTRVSRDHTEHVIELQAD